MGKCPFGFTAPESGEGGPQLPPKDMAFDDQYLGVEDEPGQLEEEVEDVPVASSGGCPFGFGAKQEASCSCSHDNAASPVAGAGSGGACPMGFGAASGAGEAAPQDDSQAEGDHPEKPCEMVNIGTTVEEMRGYLAKLPKMKEADKENYVMMVCNVAELFPDVATRLLEAGAVGPLGDLICSQRSDTKYRAIRAVANILRKAKNPALHIEGTSVIRALAVSLLDVDIRIKAVALRTIALFLSHRGIKGRLIEAGAVAGVSNVINSVVPEPEEDWQVREPVRFLRSRTFAKKDAELLALALACARHMCMMDPATIEKFAENGAILRAITATLVNCDLEALRRDTLELVDCLGFLGAGSDALYDSGVLAHLQRILSDQMRSDPASAAAAVRAMGAVFQGPKSHEKVLKSDVVEILARAVRTGPREVVLAAVEGLSTLMGHSPAGHRRVLAQGLVRPVVRVLGAGMELCSDLRGLPGVAEFLAPRKKAEGRVPGAQAAAEATPEVAPAPGAAGEDEVAAAVREIEADEAQRERRRAEGGLRRRHRERPSSASSDDTIEHGDEERAAEAAQRRAARDTSTTANASTSADAPAPAPAPASGAHPKKTDAEGIPDDLTTDDVMGSEGTDSAAARRVAAQFVQLACTSPEGQVLAVRAGAVAALAWNLRNKDFVIAEMCAKALQMILLGSQGLRVHQDMLARMRDSGVVMHARAALDSDNRSIQATTIRHLLSQVTPYTRDALNVTFAMAVLGAAAAYFLAPYPAFAIPALLAWTAILGAFATKFEHVHFFHSCAFAAVLIASRLALVFLAPANATALYVAVLAVLALVFLSNGTSPQASDAMLAGLGAASATCMVFLGPYWTLVFHMLAAFLGESLASAHDGGVTMPFNSISDAGIEGLKF